MIKMLTSVGNLLTPREKAYDRGIKTYVYSVTDSALDTGEHPFQLQGVLVIVVNW